MFRRRARGSVGGSNGRQAIVSNDLAVRAGFVATDSVRPLGYTSARSAAERLYR